MGFLKKITRPISRVLDKIVPNEIKPALPFLAAAAPFMAPGLMSLGGNTMLSRALMSGGLNLGAQLAQEGSEGEFDALSLAMASGIGALSAPGSGANAANPVNEFGTKGVVSQQSAGNYLRGLSDTGGIGDQALNFLGTGADKLQGLQQGLAADGIFSKAGAKALSIPFGQGTYDLTVAENRRLEKQQAIDDAEASAAEGASNAQRAAAIRQSMEAYGFTDDEIEDAIYAAGYKAGGRVGFQGGGTDKMEQYKKYVSDMIKDGETPVDFEDFLKMTDYKTGGRVGLRMGGDPDFSGIKGAVMAVDENMMADRSGDFFRLREEAIQKGDDDKIKEIESDYFREFNIVMPKMAKDGGRIGFKDGTDENLVGIETLKLGDYDLEGFQKKGRGNTLMFGSDDLKILSQALDYGELSDLPARQKEKIKESILRARAGIINPTELNNEIGMLRLEPDAAAFLKAITPDETMEKVFFDKEGDARIGVQKARKLMEDVAFGGQKNPTLSSDMYNKLGDEYIQDQKKDIQRRIDFNKEYGDSNFFKF